MWNSYHILRGRTHIPAMKRCTHRQPQRHRARQMASATSIIEHSFSLTSSPTSSRKHFLPPTHKSHSPPHYYSTQARRHQAGLLKHPHPSWPSPSRPAPPSHFPAHSLQFPTLIRTKSALVLPSPQAGYEALRTCTFISFVAGRTPKRDACVGYKLPLAVAPDTPEIPLRILQRYPSGCCRDTPPDTPEIPLLILQRYPSKRTAATAPRACFLKWSHALSEVCVCACVCVTMSQVCAARPTSYERHQHTHAPRAPVSLSLSPSLPD